MPGRDLEDRADLFGVPPLHVAEGKDASLRRRQIFDSRLYNGKSFVPQEPVLRQLAPVRGVTRPVTGKPTVRAAEPVRVDSRLVFSLRRERRERDAARLARAAGGGGVDDDPHDPCLER